MIAFDAAWIPVALTVLILVLAMRPVGDDHLGAERFMRILWTIPLLLVWLVYALVRLWGRG
jgi:hypothetical protein